MSMYKYESWASMIAQELKGEVENSSVDALRRDLLSLGEKAWIHWVRQNERQVFDLLGATPKQRVKRKYWLDEQLRRRLCFAAYNKARFAAHVIYAAGQISAGGSYRSTCVHAAAVGDEILARASWSWPFDEPPPFENWEEVSDFDSYVSGSAVFLPNGEIVHDFRTFGDSTDREQ